MGRERPLYTVVETWWFPCFENFNIRRSTYAQRFFIYIPGTFRAIRFPFMEGREWEETYCTIPSHIVHGSSYEFFSSCLEVDCL